jgi:hypothetical protein
MSIMIRKAAPWVSILVGLFLVTSGSYLFWRPIEPVYYHKILESRIDPPTVMACVPLTTYVRVERHMPGPCVVELHRFVAEADTGVIVWSQIAPGVAVDGQETIIRRGVLVPCLERGTYRYFFRVNNICENGMNIIAQSIGAKFEVK